MDILLISEIRRSPVEVGSLSHYLQGFIHPRWCRISSINSMWWLNYHALIPWQKINNKNHHFWLACFLSVCFCPNGSIHSSISTPFMVFWCTIHKNGLKPRKKGTNHSSVFFEKKLPANFGVGTGRSKTPGALMAETMACLLLGKKTNIIEKYMPVK